MMSNDDCVRGSTRVRILIGIESHSEHGEPLVASEISMTLDGGNAHRSAIRIKIDDVDLLVEQLRAAQRTAIQWSQNREEYDAMMPLIC